ncbi:hypothetical protein PSHT_15562 [Puccinia striiformis]|uniref:Uncharacterized protein n=1 Tax=Puccinia striiformis TaxID=27350 RepID=A0A2S4UEC4_9BASI|nr:hypothetical protein PSHT_15562 [Puccinia striiformis]
MVAVNLEPSVSISPSFGRAPGKSMTHSLIPIIADFSMLYNCWLFFISPVTMFRNPTYAASPYPLRNPNPPTRNSGETSGMTPALAENSVLDPDLRQLTDHVSPLDQNSPPPAPAPARLSSELP